MTTLSLQQREAIDAYMELIGRYPALFGARVRRPIVMRRELLEEYAAENNCVLGVTASTPHVYFVTDLVRSATGQGGEFLHPYIRVLFKSELEGGVNTAVLATVADRSLGHEGDIILVAQERHATGAMETGIPRGFGKPGLTGEQNALSELREETGYLGREAVRLGATFIDSGLTGAVVNFYHVPVIGREDSKPEVEEAILGVRILPLHELWKQILAGQIRDGFTIQALTFFEKFK